MTPIDSKNREHLKLLSTFHYIVGGLTAALSMVSLIHIGIGLSLILTPTATYPYEATPAPYTLSTGWLFFIMGVVILLLGLIFSICLILSGRALAKRKRYWFSLVVACFECIYTPFGTVLGIFTIVVLSRESVKALYRLNQR
ncbi:MAG: hypothetical protein AAGI69_13955 [Cyanobacteria bacterium P01_H01_bin.21]